MITDLIEMLDGTLEICENGRYEKNGKTVFLKLSKSQMKECRVFLPDEIEALKHRKDFPRNSGDVRCSFGCENADSFSLAVSRKDMAEQLLYKEDVKEILVLNFANPVNPGGGVRQGAFAQEEDLCRKSSLLFSLESKSAQRYYSYNKGLDTYLGSNAVIITPKVEIIKDTDGSLLDETFVAAVMTCAAPMIRYGTEGLTEAEYRNMFYERICGMLRCAAYLGYRQLVLGAFGCGVFGNDARVVSDLFYRAIKELNCEKADMGDMFSRIDFAVLSRNKSYNFDEFYRNFGADNFYKVK